MSALRNIKTVTPHLRVIKGGKSKSEKSIVENTWIFIHAALWNNQDFTEKEKNKFLQLLEEHYNVIHQPSVVFEEIIERVCLAKRYVNRRQHRYIAKPVDWLNMHYHAGLAGTEGWYREVCMQRITVPEYNKGITVLAKAITAYLKTPEATTILKFRKKLIALKQYDLLQLLNNSIINFQINN